MSIEVSDLPRIWRDEAEAIFDAVGWGEAQQARIGALMHCARMLESALAGMGARGESRDVVPGP